MDKLDEQLRDALRRVDAPLGFADRVLSRVDARPPRTVRGSWWQMPILRWAAVAAVIVGITFGTVEHRRQQRERAAGEEARRQAIIALQIAGEKLKLAQGKVQHLSGNETEER